MRHLVRAVIVVFCLALTFNSPASAASYTIKASSSPTGTLAGQAFRWQNCSSSFQGSALDGTDARVADVSGLAGTPARTFNWRAGQNVGYLTLTFFNENCVGVSDPANPDLHLRTTGNTTIKVPAGARWLLVEAFGTTDVTFSL